VHPHLNDQHGQAQGDRAVGGALRKAEQHSRAGGGGAGAAAAQAPAEAPARQRDHREVGDAFQTAQQAVRTWRQPAA